MKLFNIRNIPAFFSCVLSCEGSVAYEDGQGNRRDLKALANSMNGMDVTFLQGAAINGITLHLDHASDVSRMLRFSAGAALA